MKQTHSAPSPHAHTHEREVSSQRVLLWALLLTAGFAAIEAAGGVFAGSLALISDAGHMATDAASLGLALFAQRLARRPPSRRASYGYARAEVLAAFVNALALLGLVVFIAVEAVKRLLAPQPVAGGVVLAVASAGFIANRVTAWILSRGQQSLNIRGALLHVLSDLLGSVAAIVAGAVILSTGWIPIDPILSIAVALLIVRSTWKLLAQSIGVLMEGVPAHLDYNEVGQALTSVPGITGVHDLHIWDMGADDIALSAHVGIQDGTKWPEIMEAAQRLLGERFGIRHTTLQPSWPQPRTFGNRRVIPVAPVTSRRK